MADLRAVSNERGGSAPELPIQRGRRRLRCRVFGSGGIVDVCLSAHNAAGISRLDVVADGLKGCILASLESYLDQTFARFDRRHHGLAFTDVVTQWFLAINVQ